LDRTGLDPRRVEHESDPPAHGLRRQIAGELSAHGAGVAVGARHLAPNHSHVRFAALAGNASLVLGLREGSTLHCSVRKSLLTHPVDVCGPLADVPGGVILVVGSFHLEEGCVLALVALAPLEASEDGLGVQTTRLGSHGEG